MRQLRFLPFTLCLLFMCSSISWSQEKPRIIVFDAPVAGTGSGQGTLPEFLNPAGVIAGAYVDANNVTHGFVRSPDGAITAFEAPGAGTGQGQGTVPLSINPEGEITGSYTDSSGRSHGFLRIRDEDFISFDARCRQRRL